MADCESGVSDLGRTTTDRGGGLCDPFVLIESKRVRGGGVADTMPAWGTTGRCGVLGPGCAE